VYVNTAGIGVIPDGVDIRPSRATPGDVVIVSGSIGEHGIAVMSQREGLQFDAEVRSDTAPLHELVASIIAVCPDVHVLRDPTRGGVTATLCEIAASAGVGIEYDESSVPVPPVVAAACSFLGLDPMSVANEGKVVAFVAERHADVVLSAMRADPLGRDACVIGRVVASHPGVVTARTSLGAQRVVDLPLGEQLPRIC
jgi:hydrogenase expression/formation protein HypE